MDVSSSALAGILTRLDMVVFQRLPEGVFLRIGSAPPPDWFSRVLLDAAADEPVTIAQAFPFLERFLGDAEVFWHKQREQRLRSDPFTVMDPAGGEVTLVATAVVADKAGFLILESPADFDEHRRTLQRARENVLAHEEHLRRTGELLTPIEAAQRLTEQLAASGLAPEQEKLAAGIRDHLAGVAASIATLAPLPKSTPRRFHR